MAINREEISIRMGLDSKAVVSGLERVQMRIAKFSNDAVKKLEGVFKATVFGAASSLISSMLPTWDEIWQRVYGVGPEADRMLEETGNNLRTLREKIQKSRDDLAATAKKQQFEEADTAGKFAMLEADVQMTTQDKRAALDALNFTKTHTHTTEQLAEAQIKYNEALNKQFIAEKALKDFASKMSPQELRAEFNRKVDAKNKQVYQDRIDIGTYNMLEDQGALTDKERAERTKAIGRIGIQTMQRSIGNWDNQINKIPDSPWLMGIKASMEAAQRKAMEDVVVKVSIVQVDTK